MKDKVDKESKGFFQKSGFKLGVLLIAIMTLLVTTININTVEADGASVYDFSMYNRASEIATAFGADMAPSTDEDAVDKSPWLDGELNAGNAGGLLGYSRELDEDDGGIMGWVTSRFSANSMTYNYGQLVTLGGGEEALSVNHLLAYGLYGAQLQSVGLVNSGDIGLIQKGVGFLFSGIFWIAQLVPFLFNIILKLLVLLNPFQLFFGALGLSDSLGIPLLSDLAETIGSIYTAIQNISIVVTVPVLIGMTAISIFMFSGNTGKKVLRVFVRIFMIFAGLPIIAMTYTSIIEDLSDNMDSGGSFANYVALTQFVDTENWMKNTRLAPPVENPIVIDGKFPHSDLLPSVSRETVLEINTNRVYGNSVLADLSSVGSIGESMDHESESFNKIQGEKARDLINRYRSGDRFSASDYEGYIKAQLDGSISSSDIAAMFEPGVKEFKDHEKYGDMFEATAGVGDFGDIQWSIYNMGALKYSGADGFTGENLTKNVSGWSGNYGVSPSSTDSGLGANPLGLSPLAMYNFLNTEFGATSMTVYSPETSASAWSSNDYASVSSANVGFFGFMYTIESFVLILGSALMGIFYAIGLVQIIVSSIPRILSGVFGTALGSLAMVTKLLVSTVVLVLEIIGSMIIYMVFDGLLLSVLRSSETLINTITSQPGFNAIAAAGGLLKSAVVIILGASIVFFSIKNRTKFSKMIEEVTTDLITKLMSGLDNSMNQGNMFHDGQGVGRAAREGTIHGADGKLGTEGSGAYAAKAASGQDPDGGLGMKDAIRETLGQEALKSEAAKQAGEDYEGMGKKDTAKAIAGRYKDYKKAEAKDAVAGQLGGLATAMTMAGISDLDGGARERVSDMEQAERREIEDSRRGIGKFSNDGGNSDGLTNRTDTKAMEQSDSDDIMGDGYTKAISDAESETSEETLSGVDDLDSEVTALEGSSGVIDPEQERYGNASDLAENSKTEAYGSTDKVADEAVVAAVGAEHADTVDMDDADSHPPYEALSQEHDDYIDGLGEAAQLQSDSVAHHNKQADAMLAQADKLEGELAEMQAIPNPTDEQKQEMSAMKKDINGLRSKAEAEKSQARKGMRKAMKIDAKQKSALQDKQDAMKKVASGQTAPVAKSQEVLAAVGEVRRLENKAQKLQSDLNQMYNTGQIEGLSDKEQELAQTKSEIGSAQKEVKALQQELTQTIPESGFEQLHSNTPEQNEAYRVANGLSQEAFQEQLQATPTQEQDRNARKAVTQTLNDFAKVRGNSPQEIKQKQERVLANSLNKHYGQGRPQDEQLPKQMASAVAQRDSAVDQVAQAQQVVDDIKNSSVQTTPQVAQQAQAKLEAATTAYHEAQNQVDDLQPSLDKFNERKAYMQTMSTIQSDNNKRLDAQTKSRGSMPAQMNRARAVNANIENTNSKYGSTMLPKNAQVISGPAAEEDLRKKELAMKGMGYGTVERYQQRIQELDSEVHSIDAEIAKEEKRYRAAERSSDAIKRNSIARKLGNLKQKRVNTVNRIKPERDKLQSNAAGLFNNKIVPENIQITGGKSIQGDIGKVTHTAELLGVSLTKLSKIPPAEKLDDEGKRRRAMLEKKIHGYQSQLRKANIKDRNVTSIQGATNLVKELQSEYNRTIGSKNL